MPDEADRSRPVGVTGSSVPWLRLLPLLVAVVLLAGSLSLFVRRADYEIVPIRGTERPWPSPAEVLPDRLTLEPASWEVLPGWPDDDVALARSTMAASCRVWQARGEDAVFGEGPLASRWRDWRELCAAAVRPEVDGPSWRGEMERFLQPVSIGNRGETEGLFTGYYEASLRGSRRRHGPYQTPLHARPPELVSVDLGEFRSDLAGRRIAGRLQAGRLLPYEDRASITDGSLERRGLEILWVDDPIDAFFLHIQGSGVVEMDDGSLVRVGYAAQNGHPYTAIGRELIDRGEVPREEMSMQAIRRWLRDHPHEATELMNSNASYIFLREVDRPGAIGSLGVPLTPERSLAVDRRFLPLGVPLWLSASAPTEGEPTIQRLVVAQDTGGAIRGPVRGDLFWGHGERAAGLAGPMKSTGNLWVLWPRHLVETAVEAAAVAEMHE